MSIDRYHDGHAPQKPTDVHATRAERAAEISQQLRENNITLVNADNPDPVLVERVAKAIADTKFTLNTYGAWAGMNSVQRGHYCEMARAAIKAMKP